MQVELSDWLPLQASCSSQRTTAGACASGGQAAAAQGMLSPPRSSEFVAEWSKGKHEEPHEVRTLILSSSESLRPWQRFPQAFNTLSD